MVSRRCPRAHDFLHSTPFLEKVGARIALMVRRRVHDCTYVFGPEALCDELDYYRSQVRADAHVTFGDLTQLGVFEFMIPAARMKDLEALRDEVVMRMQAESNAVGMIVKPSGPFEHRVVATDEVPAEHPADALDPYSDDEAAALAHAALVESTPIAMPQKTASASSSVAPGDLPEQHPPGGRRKRRAMAADTPVKGAEVGAELVPGKDTPAKEANAKRPRGRTAAKPQASQEVVRKGMVALFGVSAS